MTEALPSTNWSFPTAVWFGAGRISELAKACKRAGIYRPLLVTDPGLVDLAMVASAGETVTSAGMSIEVFSDIKPNPSVANIDAGVGVYKETGRDGVIAFGGGSGIDAGKAIALMVEQTRPIRDFDDVGDNWRRAEGTTIPPIVAVPTTSGTGSEVGRAAVVTDPEINRKIIAFHPALLPAVSILDPELVIGLPRKLTAATGFDALSHCFEAFCAPGYHPMADGIALEGFRLVHKWLERACARGDDLEARGHMMAAAAMGAVAFQKGLGAVHSLSHPIGAIYDTHHGLTNGVLLPYVMDFNRPAIEERVTLLDRHAGLVSTTFEGLRAWVVELRSALGVPHTAKELGVESTRIAELAELAAIDPTAPTNPRPADSQAMARILECAIDGRS